MVLLFCVLLGATRLQTMQQCILAGSACARGREVLLALISQGLGVSKLTVVACIRLGAAMVFSVCFQSL
jgi:hypothetical protein